VHRKADEQKEASRKNMMSMSGDISSGPFLWEAGRRFSFQSRATCSVSVESPCCLAFADHHFHVSGRRLQLELEPGDARIEIVEWNESDDSDAKAASGGDERLADAAGDSVTANPRSNGSEGP